MSYRSSINNYAKDKRVVMKYIWQVITILLAAVVVILSGYTLRDNRDISKQKIQNISTMSNEEIILDAIMTRTSVRKYSDKPIEADKIETILKAGMAAPTAGNRQPWEFYVVTDRALIKEFAKVTKYTTPMNEMATAAIIVCGNPSQSFPNIPDYWIQDTSAATENILLATHAMGLGAVWCGVYPVEEQVAILRKMMDIPDELIPLNIIMMGYPDAEPIIKDKWKSEKVHYIK